MNTAFLLAALQTSRTTFIFILLFEPQNIAVIISPIFTEYKIEAQGK